MVVFVTAHVEHAVHAFDVHAVDYVLKPVEGPRLFAAIARARQRAVAATVSAPSTEEEREASAPLGDDAPAPSDRMLVRHEGQLYPIRARDVLYVEADGNYARIHLLNRRFLVRETMARLERRFDPKQFTRIHRSTIVNLDVVTEVQPYFGGDFVAILKTGTRLKVSRHYKHRLDRWVLG